MPLQIVNLNTIYVWTDDNKKLILQWELLESALASAIDRKTFVFFETKEKNAKAEDPLQKNPLKALLDLRAGAGSSDEDSQRESSSDEDSEDENVIQVEQDINLSLPLVAVDTEENKNKASTSSSGNSSLVPVDTAKKDDEYEDFHDESEVEIHKQLITLLEKEVIKDKEFFIVEQ